MVAEEVVQELTSCRLHTFVAVPSALRTIVPGIKSTSRIQFVFKQTKKKNKTNRKGANKLIQGAPKTSELSKEVQ